MTQASKPFQVKSDFIYGCYHDSDQWWPSPSTRRGADTVLMATDGCNTVAPTLVEGDNAAQLVFYLNMCQRYNMQVILPVPNPANITPLEWQEIIDAVKGHPALLAWGVQDDANSQPNAASNLLTKTQQIRVAANNGKPTYMAYEPNAETGRPELLGITELAGGECYPIGNESNVKAVYRAISNQYHAAHSDLIYTKTIAVLQAYRWPGKQMPNPGQVAVMGASALVAGAEGVLWYSYLFGDGVDAQGKRKPPYGLRGNMNVRGAIKLVGSWIMQYQDFFQRGSRVVVTSDPNSSVMEAFWLLEDKKLTCYVNRTNVMQTYLGQLLKPYEVRWVS